VCGTIDLLPTFARLAGAKVPADRVIDGKDIWPLMADAPGAKSPHEAYFYYRGTNLEAVRSGRWKLRRAKKSTALYDLGADIGEKNNVADENPGIVQRLTKTMQEFDAELKANLRPPGKVEKPA
jgi:arylsulfatase A-like enzyme